MHEYYIFILIYFIDEIKSCDVRGGMLNDNNNNQLAFTKQQNRLDREAALLYSMQKWVSFFLFKMLLFLELNILSTY